VLRQAEVQDDAVSRAVADVVAGCDACTKTPHCRSRLFVSLPRALKYNK